MMDKIQNFCARMIASSERRELRLNLAFRDDCKFRAKGIAFEPGVSGSGKDESADSVDLEAEKRAEEKIESWNALARER